MTPGTTRPRRAGIAASVLSLAIIATAACGPLATPDRQSAGPAATTATANADADQAARFCALAKDKGAANLEVFDAQSSTPEQLQQVLRNIDEIAQAAPPEIHADFALFDRFEHKLFDAGGTADGALGQEAGGQELRDALLRIKTYLEQRCDIHE